MFGGCSTVEGFNTAGGKYSDYTYTLSQENIYRGFVFVCVCACVHACVCVCVRACVCVCLSPSWFSQGVLGPRWCLPRALRCCTTCVLETNKQTDKQTNKQANKQSNKQTNNQTNNQTIKQTIKQSNKQSNKQTNNQTNKQTINKYCVSTLFWPFILQYIYIFT